MGERNAPSSKRASQMGFMGKEEVSSIKHGGRGSSLVVQWLRLSTLNAGGMGLTLGQTTKTSCAMGCGQKVKK